MFFFAATVSHPEERHWHATNCC